MTPTPDTDDLRRQLSHWSKHASPLEARLWIEAAASSLSALQERVGEMEGARALPSKDRREAAKKLLCDICACAAESDSLDLPHVITDCIEPIETLIAERDAMVEIMRTARRFMDPSGPFDALALLKEHGAQAAEILRLRALVVEGGEVVGPFAKPAKRLRALGDGEPVWLSHRHGGNLPQPLLAADLRRAAAFLLRLEGDGPARDLSPAVCSSDLATSGNDSAESALCEDCPPAGYPTDKSRCDPCPRRASPVGGQ